VVVDVFLPEMNGLEVCRRIKETIPQIQVIVLSAADDADTRARAMEMGAFASRARLVVAAWMSRIEKRPGG
jgi:two-component system, OmpR family, response regulator CpxR